MLLDTSKERLDLSMKDMLEQLNKAVEAGRKAEREVVADWLLRLADYPCLKPNWEQIAADVRRGLDKPND